VLDLAARITARGDQPFLHVVAENSALRLYERLGFRIRREVTFRGFRTPPA
jgi:predicted GNAT family acetyltransferase